MSDITKQLNDLQDKYDRQVQSVLKDIDRSQEYKAKEVAKLYDEVRQGAQNALDAERERLEVNLRVARRTAFAPPEMKGSKDPVVLWSDYRSCLEKAKQLKTPSEVREALQEAELVGDDIQAKALLHRAFELQDSKSVGDYLAQRPEEAKAYEEFMQAAEEWNEFEKQSLFFGLGRFRKPEELQLTTKA